MQVDPEHHEQGQDANSLARRSLALVETAQLPGKKEREQVGEQERAGEPMHGASEHGQEHENRCQQQTAVFREQLPVQKPRTSGDQRGGDENQTLPAEKVSHAGENHFAQPFFCEVGALECVQPMVFAYDGVMLDHPIAEAPVQRWIAIGANHHDARAA